MKRFSHTYQLPMLCLSLRKFHGRLAHHPGPPKHWMTLLANVVQGVLQVCKSNSSLNLLPVPGWWVPHDGYQGFRSAPLKILSDPRTLSADRWGNMDVHWAQGKEEMGEGGMSLTRSPLVRRAPLRETVSHAEELADGTE